MKAVLEIACMLVLAGLVSASGSHFDLTSISSQKLHENLQDILTNAADPQVPPQCQPQLEAAGQVFQSQGQCLKNLPSFGPGKALTAEKLDQICGSAGTCLRTVFPAFRALIDCVAAADPKQGETLRAIFNLVFGVFDFICTRDDSGQYCAITWQDPSFPSGVALKSPAACAYFAATGCCARTYLKFLAAAGAATSSSLSVDSPLNQTIVYCGMTDGPGCPAPGVVRKTIAVKWVLNNFNCTWLASVPPATAKLLFFYLARDISRFLGVRVGAVTVAKLSGCSRTVSPQAMEHRFDLASAMFLHAFVTAPISVSFNVRGDDDAQTAALLAIVQSKSASSSLTFDDTDAALPGVGALSNNPSEATVTTASVGNEISPASRATVVQMFAVFGAAFVALFAGKHM